MSEYEHTIVGRPDFAMLNLTIQPNQKIFVEPSAMAAMDNHVQMKSQLKGGLIKSLFRAFGGESLIVNTYWTDTKPGELKLAPGPMGDLEHYHLDSSVDLMLQRGAFVAHGENVDLTSEFQGFKGFFSGEGLMLLKASGVGDLFFNTYGGLLEVDVDGDYVVDTGFIVAFESTLQYETTWLSGLKRGSGLKNLFFGGDGLVCKFRGRGKLWVQTRRVGSFLSWLTPYRRVQKNRSGSIPD